MAYALRVSDPKESVSGSSLISLSLKNLLSLFHSSSTLTEQHLYLIHNHFSVVTEIIFARATISTLVDPAVLLHWNGIRSTTVEQRVVDTVRIVWLAVGC
jgi:hypothetical protein